MNALGAKPQDEGWRWFFRSPLRTFGLLGFLALLVAFVVFGREVSLGWLTLIAGMFGIDGLAGLLRKSGS